MFRYLTLVLLLAAAPLVTAEEQIPTGPPAAFLADVHKSPDDAKLLRRYIGGVFREIGQLTEENKLEAAGKKLDELTAALDELKTSDKDATQLVTSGKNSIQYYREQIELAPLSVADVEKALLAGPDDEEALRRWANKALGEIGSLAYAHPDQAEEKLAAAKAFAEQIAAAAQQETTKKRIAAYSAERGSFASLEKGIEQGRKLAALVGKEAAPINAQDWVNGQPVAPADLQGKVVLLDFWAVWCGPCIATFPHLREWHEQYADKGLVMIGLTRNYQYKWNEADGYCARAERGEEVTAQQERDMLQKFAAYYHLPHRFAIQEDKELADYYGVSGIPHVVVIDRQGKIRMIRVGSGKQNAADIGKLLAELLK